MPKLQDFVNIWKNVGEIDLRPIREAAQELVKITIIGRSGVGRHTLAEQMRTDPARPHIYTQTPLVISDLEKQAGIDSSHLIILMLDATSRDYNLEQEALQKWVNAGKKVLVFINKIDLLPGGLVTEGWVSWQAECFMYGSATDPIFLLKQFVPAVLEILPGQHLALGRQFPLFRVAIARHLINETCFSNAAYSLSTGLAEVIPVLDIPLNITDMVVLSKAQAFLVYKLGLTFGFSTRWQDYVAEFGSVVGGGFMWRQIARQLVGLIPVWGIVPKVAVAYSGTYVVGNVVLQWYITGKHITRHQVQDITRQALNRGKDYARKLISKAPRLRLGRRKVAELPAPEALKPCPVCGKFNAPDASFCQYCGKPLVEGV
jgi:uncharacterized protein (DUF697 family)